MHEFISEDLRIRASREHLLSRSLCEWYVLFFALFHILFFHDGFYDINRSKYYLLIYISFPTAALCIPLLYLERCWKEPSQTYEQRKPMLAFFGVYTLVLAIIISVCISSDPMAAITGRNGRYAGALFLGACCILFCCCIWSGIQERIPLFALIGGGSLCALLGILNFLRFDPLHFYVESLEEIYHNDFISTIGNINFFCAYMCLIMGLASGFFLRTKGKLAYIWLIPICLTMMGVFAARSESGLMGVGAIFLGICISGTRSMREAGRSFVLLAAFFLNAFILGNLVLLRNGNHMTLYEGFASTMMGHRLYMAIGALLALGIAIFFFTRRRTSRNLRIVRCVQRILVGLAGLALLVAICLIVYFTTIRTDIPLTGIASYLRMDDYWGTFRGFVWKKTVSLYAGLPWYQKLFGIGPDCLKALLSNDCYDRMIELTGLVFDNAHNEYLQLLITTGAFGLIGYLLIIFSAMRNLWRNMRKNPALFACYLALCSHLLQSVFNIAQPETTPAVFLLLAVGAAAGRKKKAEEQPVPSTSAAPEPTAKPSDAPTGIE